MLKHFGTRGFIYYVN